MNSLPDNRQFGSFDGFDNRKEVMRLFVKMGDGLPEEIAMKLRARFLQKMLSDSTNGFAQKAMIVTPCSAVEAWHMFVAICGCLGVKIEEAAKKLEEAISHH